MADELSKKPIKRVTVPTVSKETPSLEALAAENESTIGQNIVFLLLFLLVSGIVYVSIFEKKLLSEYTTSGSNKTTTLLTDSSALENTESKDYEEISTIIGEDKSTKKGKVNVDKGKDTVYPKGTKFYLIVGTYIFYPYAEKCVTRMRAAGYNPSIISTGENHKFHRVYIESSEDGNAVRAKRDQFLKTDGMKNVWVYAQ
jgi:hypothetical protein